MAKLKNTNASWYVYVILCEDRVLFSGITTDVDRRLKEQFSGGNRTSKFLLKNKPLVLIKKFKCKNKQSARQSSERINQLKGEQRSDFIITSLLKKPRPLNLVEVSKNHFEIYCNDCGFKSTLKCKRRDLDIEVKKFKCIHEALKEKIDMLFEQAILGIGCFHNGRFMFQGKNEDRARDFLLGFSGRGHRKRTKVAYETLDEISFKNSYLLLSAILEESYYLIHEYTSQHSSCKLPRDYKRFSFKKNCNSLLKDINNIRFSRIAHFVRQSSNVLKHSGGTIKSSSGPASKSLINEFKLKQGWDIVARRNYIKINGILIGNIFEIIIRLYVFVCDLVVAVFGFKKFRIKPSEYKNIQEKIVNYDVRETYKDFLKKVQQDGSVIFMDLQDL